MKKNGLLIIVLLVALCSGAMAQTQTPAIRQGYLYKVETTVPNRRIYVCCQRPVNDSGQLVGTGNLETQLVQSFANITKTLATVGMTPEHIVQVTYHLTNDQNKSTVNSEIVNRVAATYFNQNKAGGISRISELKNVPQQVREDVIIEVEVIAIKN
ncbi:RidA family protein [Arsenicibacter rosenii]|uniref:RidA family protein n=1 Tax=Arsenicibacter rosenii TaxID=1750698 RepID=A0A1S2VM99_9BACT|nr:RidA family protein [Arsenicibacter rosenii]OIN59879.1 hypothetical protein BLX24_08490 [Arsenicibacter rosenii]